jgi:hypothetical protein
MDIKRSRAYLLMRSSAIALLPFQGLAQLKSDAAGTGVQHSSSERDRQHDLDFHLGSWRSQISRLQHPLTGSTTWVKCAGTLVARKVWDGRRSRQSFSTAASPMWTPS